MVHSANKVSDLLYRGAVLQMQQSQTYICKKNNVWILYSFGSVRFQSLPGGLHLCDGRLNIPVHLRINCTTRLRTMYVTSYIIVIGVK